MTSGGLTAYDCDWIFGYLSASKAGADLQNLIFFKLKLRFQLKSVLTKGEQYKN
jgi:hypothetical protein